MPTRRESGVAQKEDVLEQVVEDYLQHLGYFTRHNVRYKPDPIHADYDKRKDGNHSDIDVIGLHRSENGTYGRIVAVSCKSWQVGNDPAAIIRSLNAGRSDYVGYFRELWVPKWADAFRAAVAEVSGSTRFTYLLAVTRLLQPGNAMAVDPTIQGCLRGNRFETLEFADAWHDLFSRSSTTLAPSDIGRLIQLLKASRACPCVPLPTGVPSVHPEP